MYRVKSGVLQYRLNMNVTFFRLKCDGCFNDSIWIMRQQPAAPQLQLKKNSRQNLDDCWNEIKTPTYNNFTSKFRTFHFGWQDKVIVMHSCVRYFLVTGTWYGLDYVHMSFSVSKIILVDVKSDMNTVLHHICNPYWVCVRMYRYIRTF